MCNPACIEFGMSHLPREEVVDRDVLEVGALDVNGSLREHVQSLGPRSYWGVDLVDGPGVDETCDIGQLVARFGEACFDIVVCTEVLEHVRDWREAFANLRGVLRQDGILLLTTRSRGTSYHGYPSDFWRYEIEDIDAILAGMSIEANEKDPSAYGVFVKARKCALSEAPSLDGYELYSIVSRKRCKDIGVLDLVVMNAGRSLYKTLPSGVRSLVKTRMDRG